jgi:hypothetical protein
LPVEQAHDTFDQDQVGRFRCPGQAPARIVFATHAEIEVLAGTAAGEGVNLRVEKIRAAFENVTRRPWRLCSRASAAVTVVFPGRRRSGDQQCRAGRHQNSSPGMALMPL